MTYLKDSRCQAILPVRDGARDIGATAGAASSCQGRCFVAHGCWGKIPRLLYEVDMQDINPIKNTIGDLKGRVASLRGYL